jgi:hypothetical protein
VPNYLAKVFAQVWLVRESALQRYVAQRRFSLQHVLSRQLDATPDHECVGPLSECTREDTREIRFAEVGERTKVRDKYPIRDMTSDIGAHFARVPTGQAASSGWHLVREFGINPRTQQRGCFEYRAVSCLLLIELTCSRIEERDHAVHPFVRLCRTNPRIAWRLANVHIHSQCLPRHVVRNSHTVGPVNRLRNVVCHAIKRPSVS